MSPRLQPVPSPRTCLLGRFLHARDGATAVEFGLVSVPFLALLGAVIQIAFMIWAGQNFDFLFQQTARSMFTGQFQTNNKGITNTSTLLNALRIAMCNGRPTLFDCNGVKIDVQLGTNFSSSSVLTPVNATTKDWASGFGTHYSCAGPGNIVIATAAVKFPVFFSLLNVGVSVFSDGSALLQSTAVFRTEPYVTTGTSPC